MKRLLVLLIALLLPLLFIILGEEGWGASPFFVWIVLIALFFSVNALVSKGSHTEEESEEFQPEKEEFLEERARALAKKLEAFISVRGWRIVDEIVQFEGLLQMDPAEALKGINDVIDSSKVRVTLTESGKNRVQVTLVPKQDQQPVVKKPNWLLHGTLLLLTIATTTWAGAMHQGINLLQDPAKLTVGLPYSIGLLLILAAHEFGHYFAARRHNIQVSPPYFIPVPFALGTFGAFIKIRGSVENRRALFDVAAAGPLAGLLLAIPALLVGLPLSKVIIGNAAPGLSESGVEVGSSFLMAFLSKLTLGAAIAEGHRLILHPLAFAGWLGLLLTTLNLLPIGQLDGGQIAHALFGYRRAYAISIVALGSLFLLAFFVWPGLAIWAFIAFFIAGAKDAPTANDVTPLDSSRQALGYFAFTLLALILMPVPHSLYGTFGIHCPYL
jgi:Zn-dependent protease